MRWLTFKASSVRIFRLVWLRFDLRMRPYEASPRLLWHRQTILGASSLLSDLKQPCWMERRISTVVKKASLSFRDVSFIFFILITTPLVWAEKVSISMSGCVSPLISPIPKRLSRLRTIKCVMSTFHIEDFYGKNSENSKKILMRPKNTTSAKAPPPSLRASKGS